MDLGLRDRTVLVTGASSGVGLATARMLLAEGANVAACARDAERLTTTLEVGPKGDRRDRSDHAVAADVTDKVAMTDFVEATVTALGGVDAVVCNAGGSLMASIEETTDDQIRAELELKLFGCSTSSAPPSRTSRDPRSPRWSPSTRSWRASPSLGSPSPRPPARRCSTSPAPSATHWARRASGSTPCCSGSSTPDSGAVGTPRLPPTFPTRSGPGDLAADRGVVLGRLGTAEEVAFPVLSLLSPLSGYTTGACIDVGGGVARYV